MNDEVKNSYSFKTPFGKLAQNSFFTPTLDYSHHKASPRVIIRKKKSPASFERRFLYARSKNGGNAQLEIAMIWRGNVVDVRKFGLKDAATITLGSDKSCAFNINTGDKLPITIASCDNGLWSLMFKPSMEGFLLLGDDKVDFKSKDNNRLFKIENSDFIRCIVDGNTRAKYIFGEVTLLVHYVDSVQLDFPIINKFNRASLAAVLASLLIHLSLISLILFSTDRVSALMSDRRLTINRFVNVVEVVEDQKDIEVDEVEIINNEIESPNTTSHINTESSKHSSVVSDTSGSYIGKYQAVRLANSRGILANGRMDSIIGAFNESSILNAADNWSTFDPNVGWQTGDYLLKQTGTCAGSFCLDRPSNFQGKVVGSNTANTITSKVPQNGPIIPEKEPGAIPIHTKTKVSGSLDKVTIQKTVNRHKGELKSCYERELAKIKNLHGKITALWYITPEGNVSVASIKESTMHNHNVEKCIIDSI